jgi:hypothetical protein
MGSLNRAAARLAAFVSSTTPAHKVAEVAQPRRGAVDELPLRDSPRGRREEACERQPAHVFSCRFAAVSPCAVKQTRASPFVA